VLAGVLLAGLGLRLAVRNAYEPSIDLGVRLNWARRIASAESFGPVAAARAVPVLTGDSPSGFLERVVRLEREP
jgi:hypothetical protein